MEKLPGVRVYVDDVLIWGASRKEHDARLRAILHAARAAGLTLNLENCEFGTQEIRLLGDLIGKDGIKPDKSAIQCVKNMPIPKNKQELQRLLGAVTYFG